MTKFNFRATLITYFLCDLFLFIKDTNIARYVDDSTPYTVDKTSEKLIKALDATSADLLTLPKNNEMKANADKCHLLVNTKEKVRAKIGPCDIQSSEQQILLRVLIDNKLNFDKHINNLWAKGNQKLNSSC